MFWVIGHGECWLVVDQEGGQLTNRVPKLSLYVLGPFDCFPCFYSSDDSASVVVLQAGLLDIRSLMDLWQNPSHATPSPLYLPPLKSIQFPSHLWHPSIHPCSPCFIPHPCLPVSLISISMCSSFYTLSMFSQFTKEFEPDVLSLVFLNDRCEGYDKKYSCLGKLQSHACMWQLWY